MQGRYSTIHIPAFIKTFHNFTISLYNESFVQIHQNFLTNIMYRKSGYLTMLIESFFVQILMAYDWGAAANFFGGGFPPEINTYE